MTNSTDNGSSLNSNADDINIEINGETLHQSISLIIKGLNEDFYSNSEMKNEFETIYNNYGFCTFSYLPSFKRTLVSYDNCENAVSAQIDLDGNKFHNNIMKINFKEENIKFGESFLPLPKPQKLFLISPPASPPVGWVQKEEPIPVVNYDLISAVAELQTPGQPVELISKTESTPSICVVGCENPQPRDGQKEMKSMKSLPREDVQTKRPPIK